ncbi:hypothetical protein NQ314_020367 [Rhamnusium bicolor]|uniref:Hexosyltransferase n=1 Tax=Rhamnusium bicolor TaxID=1586634 RepID=A0AAV8WLN2_9CUCU|nr:hypothetical protein NQ314_020367 [Rhamnusium bicolor]
MYFTKPKLYTAAIVFLAILIIVLSIKSKNREVYVKFVENDGLTQVNRSNKTKQKLFNMDFHYLLNNEKMCEKDSNILALFIVTSYFGNVETRSAMRRAFSREDLKQLSFRRIFLLGEAPTDKYTSKKAVEDESKRFGDIVQGNFIEAYRNLTYKHMMGLKWAKENCYKAKFVIKMDDDIVVNVERIPDLLKSLKLPKNNNFIAGYVLRNMVPIREPANKWYVTVEEYEHTTYPPFVSGWFYITNPSTCSKLVSLSQIKYFWIDDTYVTGILAKELKIRPFDISNYFTVHSEFLDCCIQDVRSKNLDCNVLIGPNGGNNNLFYDFNNVMNICNLKLCKARAKPINETCVAEKKTNLGRGNAIVESYKLH